MKQVKARSNFFVNVGAEAADAAAADLEQRLEFLVAAWMKDTGLWGATISIHVSPVRIDNSFVAVEVLALVNSNTHPYLEKRAHGYREESGSAADYVPEQLSGQSSAAANDIRP